ncbi:Predicted oxidoreductase, contains short-chain dehydrogenase (SDR) and DUF2520 domains [Saccharicrinis carchari]|uniref:Predicted oxidoreductase, contains short-chain dehydrogenase (SDR) and DUF2520 domains n=1 Tax=Saccharicrinis carchari TaxID=1168039 RepID=A0A521B2V4_SACCC|nr:DUF2520 domain-containing protein [Saccharicrinis carchari]SMO41422.1 Predicted oxidoreductase, contains short-chain dehydrogenase (SDR) and DUF2520 domains [Saccharicrinis carchari]
MIRNIVLIGSGNLATQLGIALVVKGFNIRQVYSLNLQNAQMLAHKLNAYATSDFSELQTDADLYVLAVSDSALLSVVEQLPKVKGTVVHTAGSVNMDLLIRFNKYGIFYPFQTFTKEREVNFSHIPILLEANTREAYSELKFFAGQISDTVLECDSEQRKQIHLAAVFACNFTNHMYAIAHEILKKSGVSFDVLKPLILETALKTESLDPLKAQTGPAVRGDKNVMDKHLDLLKEEDELHVLYSKISRRIARYK